MTHGIIMLRPTPDQPVAQGHYLAAEPCPKCGGTERYQWGNNCLGCVRRRNAEKREARRTGQPIPVQPEDEDRLFRRIRGALNRHRITSEIQLRDALQGDTPIIAGLGEVSWSLIRDVLASNDPERIGCLVEPIAPAGQEASAVIEEAELEGNEAGLRQLIGRHAALCVRCGGSGIEPRRVPA